ncbi:hypothetical protein A4X09_0g6481 [Tilletia walkeri]|uniref:Uncharacterized protein n=1 Tax=Tilletia walkeri TaxID=117179 RepID=A0A8X7N2L8_9BASI|nr:hypothetical protein A4X09_0g6481 [Tilletia walkeri]
MLRRRLIAPPGLARHPISAPFFGQRPPCSPAFKTLPSLLRNTSLFHRHQTDLTPGLSTSNAIPRVRASMSSDTVDLGVELNSGAKSGACETMDVWNRAKGPLSETALPTAR